MRRWMAAATAAAVIGIQAPPAMASPAAAVLSPAVKIDRLRIDRALRGMISGGRAAGVSALVFKDGREVYFGTAGLADREARRPMQRDTLVQIFSMTKPVTGVALMQLWEKGQFALDDPLSRHLPEFAQAKVFVGMGQDRKPILRAPERPILVRDVLRHTAGFGYISTSGSLRLSYPELEWARADPLRLDIDLKEFGRRLATVPLLFEPGTRWHYSAAVDVQALLVEKLSGMLFEDYVRRHVLTPLRMTDTAWTQPEARFSRFAAMYNREESGGLQRAPDHVTRLLNFAPGRKITPGGIGLATTLGDYMRFAQMLLNGGTYEGARILKPSTVRLMTTDQLDPRVANRQWLAGKGRGGFGVNLFVRTGQPKDENENRGAVGEYFWDGAASTLFWVDPVNKLAAVFFVQTQPFDGTLHRDIRRAVYGIDYVGPTGD